MRIFFTTSYSGKVRFQPFIDEVMDVLQANEAIVVSPENTEEYQKALREYESLGLPPTRAHYEFITRGIAEADLVIIEASQESLRIGHEITVALLFHKPVLVASQKKNYAHYIHNSLLTGFRYKTKAELRKKIEQFIKNDDIRQAEPQAVGAAVDSHRLTISATMRQSALLDKGDFGGFADLAEQNPEKAHAHIQQVLGTLPVGKTWSAFAYIYGEDTPDYVFENAIARIVGILENKGVKKRDHIVDAVTHGGMVGRFLAKNSYTTISSFNSSREMLSQTYKLCADTPEISIIEASPQTLKLSKPAKAVIWIDNTTNLALTEKELKHQLQNLLDNTESGGYILFDIRTVTGWKAYFLSEKVATFATNNFQRISINLPDDTSKLLYVDTFIRTKQNTGSWGQWFREQTTSRMWSMAEIEAIVGQLKNCKIEAVYDDEFQAVGKDYEPSLAYFLLKKM